MRSPFNRTSVSVVFDGHASRAPSARIMSRDGPYLRDSADLAVHFLVFVAGYLLSLLASEHLYGSLAVASPFWLPDSVLLCALLLTRSDRWWVLIVATWPIRLAAGAPAGTPLWFLCASILNDSLKAFFAAWLLKRIFRRPIRLDTLREFLVFVGIAGAAVPLLSALAAVPLRFALGDPFWSAGYQWFLGNTLAQVVVTPTLLYWCTGRHGFFNDVRWKELLLVSIGLIGVLYYAFVLPHATPSPSLLYGPVPFLLWSAVRFGPFGTANAIALVAVVAMLGAVDGTGVFSTNSSAENVLSIQLFLLVVAVSLLSLATLIAENENITEELKTVLDAAPIPILVATDPDYRPVVANRLGYRLQAPASTAVSPSVPPGTEAQLDRPTVLLRQVVATGEPVFEDAFTSVAGGIERHWIGSVAPLLGADRTPRGAVGAFLDVTERKVAEERLRESQERFRMVVDMAPVLIWMSDANKRCTFCNAVWLEFTGRSLDQELGDGWTLDVHPEDREHCVDTQARAFDARVGFEIECRLRRHDGIYRWISGHGVPRFESNGTFVGYIGSGIDITDRKDSEDALRKSQQRYAMATSAGALGVWDWNFETNELYVDPTLKSLLGFDDAEITNRPEDWGSRVHPQDLPAAAARVKACIDGETDVYDIEHRMFHKDGSAKWFLSRGSAMRGADGTLHRLVGTKVDITERKLAGEAIRENEAALQASNREIRHLAGSLITAQDNERARIARELHDDVSQQLAALSIALSGLKRRVGAVSRDEDLQSGVSSIEERAAALVESVRHLSHGLHPDVLKHGGLTAALSSHCAEISRAQPIEVTCTVEEDFESIDSETAFCLYRIAQEALHNVVKHAGARRAEIRLLRTGDNDELTITDDGRGFDVAEIRNNGKGLGLLSINERVRLAGGALSVVTERGKGTKVHVWLPKRAGASAEAVVMSGRYATIRHPQVI